MPDSPPLPAWVVDTGVLIDLHAGGLLLGASLLTGDRHLRAAAEQEGVPVHGTLWLLDEMVRLAVVSPRLAAQALERMLERGSRLPLDECQE